MAIWQKVCFLITRCKSLALFFCLWMLTQSLLANEPEVEFTEAEKALILTYGPWPPEPPLDASNRLSQHAGAIALGERLFFDPKLSANQRFACATCHQHTRAFTDGLTQSLSRIEGENLNRNTPSVLNLAGQRWFGWGGESDSLWSHSIRPLLAENEMANTPERIQNYISAHPDYSVAYQALTGHRANSQSAETVLVNIAKSLAAYQETLISSRASFDHFRDALDRNDHAAMQAYPASAKRGLKLFIGKGNCNVCHLGSRFSNGEFADIGIPFFVASGVDSGRYEGIKTVQASPYNRLGQFSDTADTSHTWWTKNLYRQHKNFGEFRVPSLRNLTQTAPYMHNGSLNTLLDVIDHYNNIDEARLHADGETILKPLNLNEQEKTDLLAFLESLSQ